MTMSRSAHAITPCRAAPIRQMDPLAKDQATTIPGLVLMVETPLGWFFSATRIGL